MISVHYLSDLGHCRLLRRGTRAGLPVVPLSVIGTRRVMPKGRLRTEPADVTLVVHDPVQPPRLDSPTPRDAKLFADQMRAIVAGTVEKLQNGWIAGLYS